MYSLETEYPDLLEEWDWEKNEQEGIFPDSTHPHSTLKVHWKCANGHTWMESVKSRTSKSDGRKCPKCHERHSTAFTPGKNDLATMFPDIAQQWSDKNDKKPSEVHYGTSVCFWWICPDCGYEWQTRVNHRTKDGQGCPACAGIAAGPKNNLAVLYPEIAAEFDYVANKELHGGKTPYDFAPHSAAEVAWQCPDNPLHKYTMRIGHRVDGYNCPYCSHHKIIPGDNSLAAEYPELLIDWDYDKNNVDPDTIAPGTSTLVWWKCHECGREWRATVADRSAKGHGCQECKQGIGTSFAEQVFYLVAKMLFPDRKIMNRYHTEFKREIDVYIPSLRLGLEPGHWEIHKNKLDKDKAKIDECAEHGIRIITIFEKYPSEEDMPFDNDCYGYSTSARCNKGHLVIRDIMKEIFSEHIDEIPEELWEDEKWDEIAKSAHLKLAKPSQLKQFDDNA